MLRTFFKYINSTLSVATMIGGVISLFSIAIAKDEYSLTLYKKSQEELVEKKAALDGLIVLYQGKQIDKLYRSEFLLANTGRKAFTKDFIYQPVALFAENNSSLLSAKIGQVPVVIKQNKLQFTWDLLNPGENLSATIISSGPIGVDASSRVKEITRINFIDEIKNPPNTKRIKSVSLAWGVAALLSIILTIDSLFIIKGDIKLQRVFDYSKNMLPNTLTPEEFIVGVLNRYKDYYESTPRLLVKPQDFESEVRASILTTKAMDEVDIELATQTIIKYARFGNLYSIRSVGFIFWPVVFGFCIIRVIIALVI